MIRVYPPEVKNFAYKLYKINFSYPQIREEIKKRFGIDVKENTIKQWIHRMRKKEEAKQKQRDVYEKIQQIISEEEYEVKKEEIKSSAKKTQPKPDTAVDRIIRKEIVEQATDIVSDYILVGKELKEKLESHAKSYGYSNVKEFVLFLFEFWEKYRYDVEKIKKLEKEVETLRLENKALKLLLSKKAEQMLSKLLEKKYFYEQIQLASLLKVIDEDSDTNVLLEVFTEKLMKKKMKEMLSKLLEEFESLPSLAIPNKFTKIS